MYQSKKQLRNEIDTLVRGIRSVEQNAKDLKALLGDPEMSTECATQEACSQIIALRDSVADLSERLLQTNKELSKTIEEYNAAIADLPATGECDGCMHAGNYRKCTSCARYPGLKDKYKNQSEDKTE